MQKTPSYSAPRSYGSSGGGGASKSKPADKFKDLSLVVANLSRVAVRGVDDAIKDILELDNSAIGKLEQGFFKKFKGDMLEVEAVALSLGHSFKDLENSIVNSFKKGLTSATEAKNALDKLNDGVEGQGNLKGAFEKLLSFGTSGGQFSIGPSLMSKPRATTYSPRSINTINSSNFDAINSFFSPFATAIDWQRRA